jgi:hypothetical protein
MEKPMSLSHAYAYKKFVKDYESELALGAELYNKIKDKLGEEETFKEWSDFLEKESRIDKLPKDFLEKFDKISCNDLAVFEHLTA